MLNFNLRYDLRRPDFCTATSAELYETAIAQCAWAENNGFSAVHLSEHHGSPDGYCPAPLVLASAIAARTEKLRLYIAALIAPLHEPVRLAEQIAVLDIISKGRVLPILSGGYREDEFKAIGKSLADRKGYMDSIGPFLNQAWRGETFEHEGRSITVTPKPHSQPRPPILMGGSSRAAARRAARHADYCIPTGPEIFELYREELKALGKPDPGPMPASATSVTFVAEDPDAYWQEIAPHLQHETNMYAATAAKAGMETFYKHCDDVDALQSSGTYRVCSPAELIDASRKAPKDTVLFHPLCGGIHPDQAWRSLRLFAAEVLPVLREEGIT
ncbi:MAG: LLM class flavin-dependent oxidoreductase [Deltaproteobacteria bacterium]|nr:LLM class flavin-dependent oxidoreductase [Deltaproteobacteria bacterium]MBW2363379.1 LLM class flavin-dependent oxidoreductase [Deltaproteobacteria bacterium]